MKQAIVMSSRAKMPSSCKYGRQNYYKIALVVMDTDNLPEGRDYPAMISDKAKGIVEIIEIYDRVFVGWTEKSKGVRILKELKDKAEIMNRAFENKALVVEA